MDSLLRDIRYAASTLRRNPTFTLVAVLTIALGIGSSTAIFSVVNSVLLKPLPYTDAERLTILWTDLRARDLNDFPWAPADFHDLRQRATLFDDFVGLTGFQQTISGDDDDPERIRGAGVTPNVFRMLGGRVILGRDFEPSDATPLPQPQPGEAQEEEARPLFAGVLSHGFWQRRYGGDPGVIGRIVDLGDQQLEIVGVLEPGFELLFPTGTNLAGSPDLWTALRFDFAAGSRINVFLNVIGKIGPGVPLAAAQSQLDALAADLRRDYPIKESAGMRIRAERMHDDLVADVRPALLALMGAVLFVLLIACANVANLLLVRASGRERELALRAALGGSGWRLSFQTVVESAMLAGLGAIAGIGLAALGIRLLLALRPADLPRVDTIAIDPAVLGFTAAAAFLAALLFGLVPALRASRSDVAGALRESGRSASLAGGGRALRTGVVVAEVALCFVLLIGSGLMLRSFAALHSTDPGFDADGVLTFLAPPRAGGEEGAIFARQMRERIGALPGVEAVTAANPLPLDGGLSNARWGPEAAAEQPDLFQQANVHFVLPGYFETMRTRLLAGRTFTEADNDFESQGVIVDEVLARKAFGARDAVGRRLLIRVRSDEPESFEVIGVVAHQRHASLAAEGRETLFLTNGQVDHGAAGRWAVRTGGDPLSLVPSVRASVSEIDALVAVSEVQPMRAFVQRAMAPTRFALVLIGIFAAIAAVLAAVGLYGVLSTVVHQRTAEIGVRMAFGAAPETIQRLFVREGLRLGIAGIAVGMLAAFALTRLMTSLLVGVAPTDPLTFVAMAALFVGIAAVASWLPARRAARLDPATAFRVR